MAVTPVIYTKAEQELITLFETAEDMIAQDILAAEVKGNSTQFLKGLRTNINQDLATLDSGYKAWAGKYIPQTYENQIGEVNAFYTKAYQEAGKTPPIYPEAFNVVHREAINVLVNKTTIKISQTIEGAGRRMDDIIKAANQEAIATKILTGSTVEKTKKLLVQKLQAQGFNAIPRKDGTYMSLEAYSRLVARSTTREATNLASINQTLEVGDDLVKMSEHYPTCPVCLPLQGRVYSISGKSAIYPPLTKAWTGPYANIHPNCRHVFNPWIEDLKTPEEKLEAGIKSGQSFDIDKWDKAAKAKAQASLNAYHKDQAFKAKRWREKKDYKALLAAFPDDAPKSFSGYLQMKNANSPKWQQLMQAKKSQAQIIKQTQQPFMLVHYPTGEIRGFATIEELDEFKQLLYQKYPAKYNYQTVGVTPVQEYLDDVADGFIKKAIKLIDDITVPQKAPLTPLEANINKPWILVHTDTGDIMGFDEYYKATQLKQKMVYEKGYLDTEFVIISKADYVDEVGKGYYSKASKLIDDTIPTPQSVTQQAAQAQNITNPSKVVQATATPPVSPLAQLDEAVVKAQAELDYIEDLTKIKKAQKDKLKAELVDLDNEKAAFKKDLERYQQSLADLEYKAPVLERSPVKTIMEAQREGATKYGQGWTFEGMTLAEVNDTLDALELTNKTFGFTPKIKDITSLTEFKKVINYNPGSGVMGVCNRTGNRIGIKNYKYEGGPDAYHEMLKNLFSDGWFSTPSKYHVAAHEIGHAYMNELAIHDLTTKGDDILQGIQKIYDDLLRFSANKEVAAGKLSKYGIGSNTEMVAEAIADLATGYPKKVSLKIFDTLKYSDTDKKLFEALITQTEETIAKINKQLMQLSDEVFKLSDELIQLADKWDEAYDALEAAKVASLKKSVKYTGNSIDDQILAGHYNTDKTLAFMQKYLDESEKYLKTISPAKEEAVKRYTGSEFRDINHYLRKGESGLTYHSDKDKARIKQWVKDLDDVISNAPGFEENTILYRSVTARDTMLDNVVGSADEYYKVIYDKGASLEDKTKRLNAMAKGREWVDDAYGSTAYYEPIWDTNEIIYTIYTPKGTPGTMLVDPISSIRGEREVLMQRGRKYQIIDIEVKQKRPGVEQVHMRLMVIE